MPFAETVTAIGVGAQALAALLGTTDRNKKMRKYAQLLLKNQIIPGLQQGTSAGEIGLAQGAAIRGAMPVINQIAGRASAKFGSRSGLTLGAGVTAAASAISPQIARLYSDKIQNRQQNLRALLAMLGQQSMA